MDSLVFVLLNAVALVAAWGLARVLIQGAGPLERTVATLAGLPVIVIATLTVLGSIGWLTAAAAGIVLLLVAGLAISRGVASAPSVTVESERPGRTVWAVTGAILGLLVLQIASFVRAQLLTGWTPHWDDLSYHGPMSAAWLQAERLVLAPYHYHGYYPGNGELFAAWFMLPTKLDGYASLAGAYWMLLGGASVALLCRRLGCSIAGAALGASVLLLCEPFWHHAGTFAAVDFAGASATAAAIALTSARRTEPASLATRRAWLIGGLFGVAIGCKITLAPLAFGTLLYLLFEQRPTPKESLRIAGAFAAAVLLCGGFYYARNLWITGNPLFPAAVLGFEGPMGAEVRRPTSLLYQLRTISDDQLAAAWQKLLDWPHAVAYALLAAYAATLLACVHPRTWKESTGRLALALLVLGLLALAVTAAGPFSGTPNSRFPRLQIRLRFFLPVALLAVPLVAYWLQRLGRGTPWAIGAGAVGAALVSNEAWGAVLLLAALGAGAAVLYFRTDAPRRARAVQGLAVAAVILGPAAAAWAMTYKQPANDLAIRKVIRAWNVVDDEVPPGSRIAWFSTFEAYKYYRAFGRRLELIPIPVGSDGARIPFLHEYWRDYDEGWWSAAPMLSDPTKLMRNLRANRVRYVLVMKRHEGPWPEQREVLLKAPGVRAIKKRKSLTLFEIDLPKPKSST